jgi:hypothetical protein
MPAETSKAVVRQTFFRRTNKRMIGDYGIPKKSRIQLKWALQEA